jgi:hypothetical protein
LRTGINYQLHRVGFVVKGHHGVLQGILYSAIPVGVAQGTGPVSPGINFNLHIINITKKPVFGKEGRGRTGLDRFVLSG